MEQEWAYSFNSPLVNNIKKLATGLEPTTT